MSPRNMSPQDSKRRIGWGNYEPMDQQTIQIICGHGKQQKSLSITIPTNEFLIQAATSLRNNCGSNQSLYDHCCPSCIIHYLPKQKYTITDVDLFTGKELEVSTDHFSSSCDLYYFNAKNSNPLTYIGKIDLDITPPEVRFSRSQTNTLPLYSHSQTDGKPFESTSIAYERSSILREACIQHHKAICAVCRIDFGKSYGSVASGFIHVHHLNPLSETGKEHTVCPIKDLIPLCPNCHAVSHMRDPPFTPAEIKNMISNDK